MTKQAKQSKPDPKDRKILQRRIDVDTNKLYASLPEAISYLQQMSAQHSNKPDMHLKEHWTGYEDMDMVFEYHSPETDEEYNTRQKLEAEEAARHLAKLKEEARKKKIQNEIERLRKQL